MTDELIVEADVIESNRDSAGNEDFLHQQPGKFSLAITVSLRRLRRNAGDHDGVGAWQRIVVQFDEYIVGLADRIQVFVGPDTGKLHDAVTPRVETAGLKIIEKERPSHHSPCCSSSVNVLLPMRMTLSPVAP